MDPFNSSSFTLRDTAFSGDQFISRLGDLDDPSLMSSGNSPDSGGEAIDDWLLCRVRKETADVVPALHHVYATPFANDHIYFYVRDSKLNDAHPIKQAGLDAQNSFADKVRLELESAGDTNGFIVSDCDDPTLLSLLWMELCSVFHDAAKLRENMSTDCATTRPFWRCGDAKISRSLWQSEDAKVTRSFWRHVLIYAIIASKHDDQLLYILRLEPEQLRVRLLGNLCRMPIEGALHAIALLRRLLVQCGGPQNLQQYWFPRSRYMSSYVMSELFGTSAAPAMSDLEAAVKFTVACPEGIPTFAGPGAPFTPASDEQSNCVSEKAHFWLRCKHWMVNVGVTCSPSLNLPDLIGFYITESQAIEIEKCTDELSDSVIYEGQFRHLQGLLRWYYRKWQSERSRDLENHLYLASAGYATYLRNKLRSQFSKTLLIDFAFIQELAIDPDADCYKFPVAQLIHFSDLLHSKTHFPRRSISVVYAARKASEFLDAGTEPAQVDDIHVRYWMRRMRGIDHESAYKMSLGLAF